MNLLSRIFDLLKIKKNFLIDNFFFVIYRLNNLIIINKNVR